MALSPTNDAALMQEVDEAVRKDQLGQVWSRFGRWIVAAVIAALLGLGGWLYWSHRQDVARGEQAEQLVAAFDKIRANQPRAATTDLIKLQASGGPAYRFASIVQQANLKATAGDTKAAAALLSQLAGDDALDPSVRELALIRQTAIEFDALKPADVLKRMQPIVDAKDPASSWFPSAAELAAVAHYQLGQFDQAGALYGRIAKTPDIPQSLQSRAVQMAGMLGVDAVTDRAAESQKKEQDNAAAATPQSKDATNAK